MDCWSVRWTRLILKFTKIILIIIIIIIQDILFIYIPLFTKFKLSYKCSRPVFIFTPVYFTFSFSIYKINWYVIGIKARLYSLPKVFTRSPEPFFLVGPVYTNKDQRLAAMSTDFLLNNGLGMMPLCGEDLRKNAIYSFMLFTYIFFTYLDPFELVN